PGGHAGEVGDGAHGDRVEPVAGRDGGDVGGWEGHRAVVGTDEVVDLGAVGVVVVDDHDHRQPEAPHRVELGGAHERAAVAERRDGQPVGAGQGGADRGGQPEAHRLERLGEAEPLLVRDVEVHARVAHEIAGVDGEDPLGGEQVVQGDA